MVDISRRQVIVVGGSAVVAAAGGVTVFGGGDGGDGSSPDSTGDDGDSSSSGGSNVIQGYEVISGDSGTVDTALSVTVSEGEADQVALMSDGDQVASIDIAPGETQAVIPISGTTDDIPPSTNEIVASSGDTVVDRAEWSPTIDISVTDVVADQFLSITLQNDSDITTEVTNAYISGGYPTEVHGTDRVAEDTSTYSLAPGEGVTIQFKIGGLSTEVAALTPPNEECNGETRPVEVALSFADLAARIASIDVTLGGQARESDRAGQPIYCSEMTATLSNTETAAN